MKFANYRKTGMPELFNAPIFTNTLDDLKNKKSVPYIILYYDINTENKK
jgi:hypothetical protein